MRMKPAQRGAGTAAEATGMTLSRCRNSTTISRSSLKMPDSQAEASELRSTPPARTDLRARRSRERLLRAFFTLVLSQPWETLSVESIAARAGVARSTFYAHFAGRRALLAASLAGPMSVLADTVRERDNTAQLLALLEHFWANRGAARTLFGGNLRAQAITVLRRAIEVRLRGRAARAGRLPRRLEAVQLAEALFAPLTAWLQGEAACPASVLARALRAGAQALRGAQQAGDRRAQDAGAAAASFAARKS